MASIASPTSFFGSFCRDYYIPRTQDAFPTLALKVGAWALTIFSGGLFLLPLLGVHLYRYYRGSYSFSDFRLRSIYPYAAFPPPSFSPPLLPPPCPAVRRRLRFSTAPLPSGTPHIVGRMERHHLSRTPPSFPSHPPAVRRGWQYPPPPSPRATQHIVGNVRHTHSLSGNPYYH